MASNVDKTTVKALLIGLAAAWVYDSFIRGKFGT